MADQSGTLADRSRLTWRTPEGTTDARVCLDEERGLEIQVFRRANESRWLILMKRTATGERYMLGGFTRLAEENAIVPVPVFETPEEAIAAAENFVGSSEPKGMDADE